MIDAAMLPTVFTILAVMLALDAVWLTSTAAEFRSMLARIQGEPLQMRWIPAGLVYIIMTIGLYYFAVSTAEDWKEAAIRGAGLGLLVYGTYDLTNLATIKHYSPQFAASDMMWGTFLFGSTAAVAKYIF